jgi:arginosuccinate synthase-like protein
VPDYVYSRTEDPEHAPQKPAYVTLDFERGDPVAVKGKKRKPAELLAELNTLGRRHGIGRLDLVENRFVGMKSRGMYETPGGTILLAAHRGIEQITLDRGAAHLKDELMPKYAELIYYGFWFSPEREMLQAAIDKSQEFVTGRVRLKLYKGNVGVVGRESRYSLYDQDLVTFEDGKVAYDQRDAEGFIRLNALRLRTLGQRKRRLGLGDKHDQHAMNPSQNYQTIWRAVRERKVITFAFDGKHREACPIILGYSSDGRERVLAFQTGGETSPGSKLPGWRAFDLSEIGDLQLSAGRWAGGERHTQTQSQIRFVDVDVNIPDTLTRPKPLMFGSAGLRAPRV